jgi:hypothetical protein
MKTCIDGGEWSASSPERFTSGSHWIGAWVGPRAGLDAMEKRKSCVLAENRTSGAQPVARCYTD